MTHWAFIFFSCYIYVILGVYFSIEVFFVYLLFHKIYQNYYFSGKIKQKPFSEVIQYCICFATTFSKPHNCTIKFYNNSIVTYQNSTFSGLTRNEQTRKWANWIKINNYLTLEVNMLNVHVYLLKYDGSQWHSRLWETKKTYTDKTKLNPVAPDDIRAVNQR